MVEWLFGRPLVIALAVCGGAISILASWCHSRRLLSEESIASLNKTAYAFMGASMVLFICIGIFGVGR